MKMISVDEPGSRILPTLDPVPQERESARHEVRVRTPFLLRENA